MWKAYRCPETANECYGLAKTALKEILDSGTYELNPSFTTLWDADEVWGKEAIWQAVLNEGDQWGGWDGAKWSEAHGWVASTSVLPPTVHGELCRVLGTL